jgi:hypothetical protein
MWLLRQLLASANKVGAKSMNLKPFTSRGGPRRNNDHRTKAGISRTLQQITGLPEDKWLQRRSTPNMFVDQFLRDSLQDYMSEYVRPGLQRANYRSRWLTSFDISNAIQFWSRRKHNFAYLGTWPNTLQGAVSVMKGMRANYDKKRITRFAAVFNTSPRPGDGEHWVAYFLDLKHKSLCFFDSFGRKPKGPLAGFDKAIPSTYRRWYNEKKYQLGANQCGIYVIYWVLCQLGIEPVPSVEKLSDGEMMRLRTYYFRLVDY